MRRNNYDFLKLLLLSFFFSTSAFFMILGGRGLAAAVWFIFPIFVSLAMLLLLSSLSSGKEIFILSSTFLIVFSYISTISKYAATISLSFFLMSFPFAWYILARRKEMRTILDELGFRRKSIVVDCLIGAASVIPLYIVMIIEMFALQQMGLSDVEKVAIVVEGAPIYILLFAVLLSPFSEELFFRSFLIPRIGILLSSVIFSLAHYNYGSIAEFVGTFTVGLFLGFIYRWRRSIVTITLTHAIFNLTSILLILFGGSYG